MEGKEAKTEEARWAQRGFLSSFYYAFNGVLRTVATQRTLQRRRQELLGLDRRLRQRHG